MKSEKYICLFVCTIAALLIISIIGYNGNQDIQCRNEDENGVHSDQQQNQHIRGRCPHRNNYHVIRDGELDDVVYIYDNHSFHNRHIYEHQNILVWNDDEPILSCVSTDNRNSSSRNYDDSCEYLMDDDLSVQIDQRAIDFSLKTRSEAANSTMEGRIRHRELNEFRVHIPLYIFVIHDHGRGFLNKTEIRSIHNIANAEMNRHGFYFSLRKVYYIQDTRWFYSKPNDEKEKEMKEHLHEGNGTTLNIYVKRNEGMGTYPWNFPCWPKLDGISISYMRIPGGEDPDYNQGKTIVHQIGHWLGLKHVFGWSCEHHGDGVSDTNMQRFPSRIGECPSSQDTCPDQGGPDNTRNFMDLSSDECRVQFTRGQEQRMHTYWNVRIDPITWFASFEDPPCRTRDDVPLTGLAGFNKSFEPYSRTYQKTVACFSPLVTVLAKDRGSMMMRDVKFGDRVLTSSGEYQEVFTMDHFHPSKPTRFLQIHTETYTDSDSRKYDNEHIDYKSDLALKNKRKMRQLKPATSASSTLLPLPPLEITAKHMVFVSGISNPTPASNIRVGDYIQSLNGPRKVTNITTIVRSGLYNPITADGTIIVGDSRIVASAYSSHTDKPYYESSEYKLISAQTVAEWAYAPYRVLCTKIVPLHLCNQHSELAGLNKLMHGIFESYWLYQHEYSRFIVFAGYVSLFGPINLIIRLYAKIITAAAAVLVFQFIRNRRNQRQRRSKVSCHQNEKDKRED